MPRWASRLSAENVGVQVKQRDGAWKWRTTLVKIDAEKG
jgi:hypothetical protein